MNNALERETGKKTSFWNFIKNNKIKIPIIQRDYAQGRADEENIRESFVHYLKKALDSNISGNSEPYILDFIYGSKSHDTILPLDGQQRLTTLWLLHWYMALKKDAPISEDEKHYFFNFSYETRESSRNFIKRLAGLLSKKENKQQYKISDYITKHLWFLKDWNNDQTITSMLIMLDYIDEVFKESPLETYWNNLISDKAAIVFYELKLENFGLTDDLYIKMNARGKPLTNFENFKADFVGYLTELENNKESDENTAERISRKLDTDWTDIFWENRYIDESKNCHIDEIYFGFLNRYFLGEWIAEGSVTSDDIDKDVKLHSLLYGSNQKNENKKEIDDSKISYSKFDVYEEILNDGPKLIGNLERTLDNFSSFLKLELNTEKKLQTIQQIFYPNWDKESKFRFIPDYSKDENGNDEEFVDFGKNKILKIQTINQMERPIFFAICKYFEYGEYEKKSFDQWMRFSWNLVSDPRLRDTNAMIQSIKKLKEYSENSHNIYEKLSKLDISTLPNGTALTDQFIEECEKVRAICTDNKIESIIKEAESTAFFKGQIRFLYNDCKEDNKEPNWTIFKQKFENAKKYFDTNGLKEIRPITHFISYFEECPQLDKLEISQKASCWKKLLINDKYAKPIHDLLLNYNDTTLNFSSKIKSRDTTDTNWEKIVKSVQHELCCNEELLRHVCSDMDSEDRHPTVHFWWNEKFVAALYQRNAHADRKKIILGMKRNAILSDLYCGDIEENCQAGKITSNQKISNIPFFWGRDIEFYYKERNGDEGNWFKWTLEDKIQKWNEKTNSYLSMGKNVFNASEVSVEDLLALLEK